MLQVRQKLPVDQSRLLDDFRQLSEERRQTLLAFAAFLRQQQSDDEQSAEAVSEPLAIPRPDKESVVAAMRRLTATYPMIDTHGLLDQASVLMSAHLLQGKPAVEVIDELELLFEQHFLQTTNNK